MEPWGIFWHNIRPCILWCYYFIMYLCANCFVLVMSSKLHALHTFVDNVCTCTCACTIHIHVHALSNMLGDLNVCLHSSGPGHHHETEDSERDVIGHGPLDREERTALQAARWAEGTEGTAHGRGQSGKTIFLTNVTIGVIHTYISSIAVSTCIS